MPRRPRILIYIELSFNDGGALQDVGLVKALELPDRQEAAGVLEKNVRRPVAVEIVCGRNMPTGARISQICLIEVAGERTAATTVIAVALPERQSAVIVLPQKVARKSGIRTAQGCWVFYRGVATIEVSCRHDVPSRPGEGQIKTIRCGRQPASVAVLQPDCLISEVIEQDQVTH